MINKNITFELSNGTVTSINIKRINENTGVLIADCLDSTGNILANNQWFVYKGTGKTVPFTLTKTEIASLNEE